MNPMEVMYQTCGRRAQSAAARSSHRRIVQLPQQRLAHPRLSAVDVDSLDTNSPSRQHIQLVPTSVYSIPTTVPLYPRVTQPT
jgi:hypothetical protein